MVIMDLAGRSPYPVPSDNNATGRSSMGGHEGEGHISAFLRQQGVGVGATSHGPGGALLPSGGPRMKMFDEKKGLDNEKKKQGCGGGDGALFPRSATVWQLQRRLQGKAMRLQNGLSSQVSFQEVEGEVQVSKKCGKKRGGRVGGEEERRWFRFLPVHFFFLVFAMI